MKKSNTLAATSAAVIPAAIVEDAWQEVGASFERFCLTSGLATFASMLEEDTTRVLATAALTEGKGAAGAGPDRLPWGQGRG